MSSDLAAEAPLQIGQGQHPRQEVERQFPRLVELAPDAVFLHGPDGRFVYVNDAACAMLSYSRDELLFRHIRWSSTVSGRPAPVEPNLDPSPVGGKP